MLRDGSGTTDKREHRTSRSTALPQPQPPPSRPAARAGGKEVAALDGACFVLRTYDTVAELRHGVAPLPIPTGSKRTTFASGPSLALAPTTKYADDAWRTIEYLETPENLVRFNTAASNSPPGECFTVSAANAGPSARPAVRFDLQARRSALRRLPDQGFP